MLQLRRLLGRSCISSSTRYSRILHLHAPRSDPQHRSTSSRSSNSRRRDAVNTASASDEASQNVQDLKEEETPKAWRIMSSRHREKQELLEVSELTSHWTFEDLQAQSDVNHTKAKVSLRVDWRQYRNNISLWLVLLRHRARVYGDKGILDIWHGMHARQVRPPVQGAEAAELWTTVVEAAFRQRRMFNVMVYAKNTQKAGGMVYELLYDLIIGQYLSTAKKASEAWYWHRELKKIGLPMRGTFARLAKQSTSTTTSLELFEHLYRDSDDNTLYDTMITTLCNQHKYQEATHWHDLLISKNDYPSNAAITGPLMTHLRTVDSQEQPKDKDDPAFFSSRRPIYGKQWTDSNTTLSRSFMNKVLGEKHGIKPKFISDQTCAKAFATSAFSVDFVMRSLSAFGVESLGPLALRQIGLRSSKTSDFVQSIKALTGLGIKVDDCNYSQLLLKIAANENENMFHSLLATDQHPDVFEDKPLQLKLLAQYIKKEDWQQAHVAIVALVHGYREPIDAAYNVLLRARIDAGDVNLVYMMVDEMIDSGINIETRSTRHAFFRWTPSRRPGQRTVTQEGKMAGVDDTIIMIVRILRRNVAVDPCVWRQLLVSLGMQGRLEDLEGLSVWLALQYGQDMPLDASTDRQRVYRELFPTLLQKAFVAWSFLASAKGVPKAQLLKHLRLPNTVSASTSTLIRHVGPSTSKSFGDVVLGKFYHPEALWSRGIAILRVLKHCGVYVDRRAVRSACIHRLRQLFGHQVSNRRRNRIARVQNKMSFLEVLRHINCAWKGQHAAEPLFPEVRRMKKMPLGQRWLYLQQLQAKLLGTAPQSATVAQRQLMRKQRAESARRKLHIGSQRAQLSEAIIG